MCEAVEEYGREQKDEGIKEGIKEGRKEAREETLIESIRNVMNNLKVSAEQAMKALEIPESEYSKYLSKL